MPIAEKNVNYKLELAILRKIPVCTSESPSIFKIGFIKYWEPINIYGNRHLCEKTGSTLLKN